nr:lasso peptide biosynthesis B2 protein [Caulobacter sp. 602-2]
MARSGRAAPLAAGVHGVAIDDDVVLLDEGADAYYCLAAAAGLFSTDAGGVVRAVHDEIAPQLQAAGMIGQGDEPRRAPPRLPRRSIDLWAGPFWPGGRAALRLVGAGLAAERDFRLLPLGGLLERARRRRRPAPSPPGRLEAACVAYAALRPWAPFGGACLQRSYMMLIYLRSLGLDADWVIGVRTWPFAAHCWLQAGDVALDDDHERLAAYTPLMVV